MKVAGDLLFKAADFPMAEEVAERLHRTIPAEILGEGPTPEMQDATQKMQHMGQMIEHLSQELQQAKGRADDEQQRINIEAYRAESDRMKALGPVDAQLVSHLATQVVIQMMQGGSPEGMAAPQMQPPQLPPPPQQAAPQPQPNPPSAGFSLPAPQGQ
jgi:hypothetical protein